MAHEENTFILDQIRCYKIRPKGINLQKNKLKSFGLSIVKFSQGVVYKCPANKLCQAYIFSQLYKRTNRKIRIAAPDVCLL